MADTVNGQVLAVTRSKQYKIFFHLDLQLSQKTYEMDDHEGTCYILLKPAKRRKSSNFNLCIICQGSDDEPVRKAQVSSIKNFLSAMELRRDDVFDRLEPVSATVTDRQIVWHSCCYETYTSRQNLRYVVDQNGEQAKMPESTTRRARRISFDVSQ